MNYTTEELLQLAIRAMNNKADDHALSYLNQAYDQDSQNPGVNYLLAAQFAEMGLYDKSLDAFKTTLEIEPNMHYARFQFGLLQLSKDISDSARNNFELLTKQDANPELALFSRGMVKLIEEDFENSKVLLNEGKSINTLNPALNADIDKILHEIDVHLKGDSGNDTKGDGDNAKNKIFLSAYQNND